MSANEVSVIVFNAQYFSGPEVNDHKILMPVDKDQQIERIRKFADLCYEKDPDTILGNEFQENSSPTHDLNQADFLKEELKARGLGDYEVIRMGGFNFEESESPLIWRMARWTYNNDYVRENFLIKRLGFGKVEIPSEKLGPVRLHTSDVILTRYPYSEQNHQYFFPTPPTKLQFYFDFVTQKDEREGITSCIIHHPAFDFIFHGLHLPYSNRPNREKQAEKVSEIVDDYLEVYPDLPQIIAGDFNSAPEGLQKNFRLDRKVDALERIVRHPALHCHPDIYPRNDYVPPPHLHATYPSLAPEKTIDAVLLRNDLYFTHYEVCRLGISDHEPVYVKIAKRNSL
ncbi:MAG TPA: endonuclease/exonuclease/phosphatase family protein [Candidatus Nanoarchaeia archaeon]|nr:endonuclease/exonuclease/phosphatase family protein [Candidatus Nanoarchaeia archaeon]